MRRIVLVIAAALIGAPPAEAKLDARLSVFPSHPRLGKPATIFLRPYWPVTKADGSCCHLVPAKVRYPFQLQALGPAGRNVLFRPKRTDDPYVWSARFRFAAPGRWEIRWANAYGYQFDRCVRLPRNCAYAGPRSVVRVTR